MGKDIDFVFIKNGFKEKKQAALGLPVLHTILFSSYLTIAFRTAEDFSETMLM